MGYAKVLVTLVPEDSEKFIVPNPKMKIILLN